MAARVEGKLLQEIYADDPWKLLVGCVLLNLTSREQVDRIRDELFDRWPGCVSLAHADLDELTEFLKPLGLQNRRARTLKELSVDWLVVTNEGRWLPSEDTVAEMHGVGPYALDSYRFFVLNDTSRFDSGDKELAAWLERNPSP